MFRTVKDLQGYAIRATDGVIGQLADFFFDDEDWVVRYRVADTGGWLAGRHVLISPVAVGHPDFSAHMLPVSLMKDQVEHSPDIDTHKPVSRQHEAQYLGYYGYSPYWGGAGLWGMGAYPDTRPAENAARAEPRARRRDESAAPTDECHLRSCKAVMGHHIQAIDGEVGHIENLLVDDRSWAIRYLVVDTSNWWGGHRVLIASDWIQRVSWSDATVSVDLRRQGVTDAPSYNPEAPFERQQEAALYAHYRGPGYWTKAIRKASHA